MLINKKKLVIAHLFPLHTVDQFSLSDKKEGPWISMVPYRSGIFLTQYVLNEILLMS